MSDPLRDCVPAFPGSALRTRRARVRVDVIRAAATATQLLNVPARCVWSRHRVTVDIVHLGDLSQQCATLPVVRQDHCAPLCSKGRVSVVDSASTELLEKVSLSSSPLLSLRPVDSVWTWLVTVLNSLAKRTSSTWICSTMLRYQVDQI